MKNSGWLTALGIILIILGIIALGSLISTAIITLAILGWLIFIFGLAQLVQVFGAKSGGEIFLHLLAGAFGVIIGLLIVFNPGATASFLTTILAIFFIAIGLYRLIYAFSYQNTHRGWSIAFGIISLVLGLILVVSGPTASLTVIGLFVGLELILYGASLIAAASAIKNLPPK